MSYYVVLLGPKSTGYVCMQVGRILKEIENVCATVFIAILV